jgi:hypothetical protein
VVRYAEEAIRDALRIYLLVTPLFLVASVGILGTVNSTSLATESCAFPTSRGAAQSQLTKSTTSRKENVMDRSARIAALQLRLET